MRLLPRREPAPLTATVVYASAMLHEECSGRVIFTWLQVPLENAHDIANEPLVRVYAYSWDEYGRERAWAIDVLALVDAEADELMDQARGGLLADIASGRVERGTHDDRWRMRELGTSSDRRERVLAAYWNAEVRAIGERVRE
ncbi:hypothetical protein [Actinocrinis sp.]|uniref:hypothetical protein n=1 Tax=Actinocrinis sp. TaxID=1920516 RepID=UPI002D28FB09|nr:hypothetical protein [Actinocrinis sp.]HZP54352.1 hypothetical protein [Actinocrinis sp.]